MSNSEISNVSTAKLVAVKKRTRAPRGTPTKAALRKAAVAAKQAYKRAWERRCASNRWVPNSSYGQPAGIQVMHRAAAQSYFRLRKAELDTLPYIEFDNKNHPAAPAGKSYEYLMLLSLVHVKFASLAGLPKDVKFKAQGKALFDAYAAKLDANRLKYKQKPRTPAIWVF
ncbi:hypothetical protein DFH09DRAFT_1353437 [Mycena vulgaris]|nr:hypothetical protein DFH09DRAFT_1353437 [Mycena vulgaris]